MLFYVGDSFTCKISLWQACSFSEYSSISKILPPGDMQIIMLCLVNCFAKLEVL